MKERPKVCIFCGSKELSREDYIPKWLKGHIPNGGWADVHTIDGHVYTNGKTDSAKPRIGRLQRGDKQIQKTLRVVCRNCNNGWMSVLNNDTRAIVLAYLNGGWAVQSKSESSKLAAWTTLHVMVREVASEFVGISHKERVEFFSEKVPGRRWSVWIARLDNHEPVIHSTIGGVRSELPKKGKQMPFIAHTVAAFVVLGRLIIHCVATDQAPLLLHLRGKYSKQLGFAPIWFGEPIAVGAPVRALSLGEYAAIRLEAPKQIMKGFVEGFR